MSVFFYVESLMVLGKKGYSASKMLLYQYVTTLCKYALVAMFSVLVLSADLANENCNVK